MLYPHLHPQEYGYLGCRVASGIQFITHKLQCVVFSFSPQSQGYLLEFVSGGTFSTPAINITGVRFRENHRTHCSVGFS